MKATCPKNPEHNRFVTTVHEMREWVVEPNGTYVEDKGCIQVDHGPDIGNIWTCYLCGAEAKVEP